MTLLSPDLVVEPASPPARDDAPAPSFGERRLWLQPRHGDGPRAVRVRYALHGPDGAPVVIAQGGISADRRVCAGEDGAHGWWSALAGPGAAIDTTRVRVLAIDWLDRADLGAARAVGSEDQADALAALLIALGLGRAHAFVGASYGAMVGLAFAARHPQRLGRLVAIAGAHRAHPLAVAVRALQREIVRFGARHGDAAGGLDLARRLAMTTYRGEREFALRFGAEPEFRDGRYRFAAEGWLEAAGARFAARFDAERILALSESIDLHAVDPAAVRVPATLIAFSTDRVVPLGDLCELQRRLGAPAVLHVLDSPYGHDAFLKDAAQLAPLLREAIAIEGACHD
ncbi:homoserine acetyltransferase [Mizugakiibacter sediminis]|uniref:Homoserine acetyltransferase n=2 Tax=Mizugakiibacter sediminis TaxID=1475481 RepID=A0A0K8QQB5_9GAMM|nr:homoserine O-succinyltransferase [Mizugakiibacter sediminis]GAP67105.1 homoserine acetyltransferase [Mizugakiibacter sediminis]